MPRFTFSIVTAIPLFQATIFTNLDNLNSLLTCPHASRSSDLMTISRLPLAAYLQGKGRSSVSLLLWLGDFWVWFRSIYSWPWSWIEWPEESLPGKPGSFGELRLGVKPSLAITWPIPTFSAGKIRSEWLAQGHNASEKPLPYSILSP